jgi:putative acetyltransferase
VTELVPPVDLRLACVDDVPAVVAFVTEVLAEFGLAFGSGAATDDQLRGLPESYAAHGGAFWVARDPASDALLGTCGVCPVADGVFELRKMYLAPAARGRGVGRYLLEVAVAFARERGGRRMVLDTVEAMTRAIAFYEAHGFVRDDAEIRGARCTRGYAREL